jgi:hypothetical protein
VSEREREPEATAGPGVATARVSAVDGNGATYSPSAGALVLVDGSPPMVAEVVDPRPYLARDVVKVVYSASRTGAYVAAKRILGPVSPGDRGEAA